MCTMKILKWGRSKGTERHLFSSDRQAGISEDTPKKANTSRLKSKSGIVALQEILVVALDRCFLRYRLPWVFLADYNRITGKEQGIQQNNLSMSQYDLSTSTADRITCLSHVI